MMKLKLFPIFVCAVFFLMVLTTAVLAQEEEVPEPYVGLENPFPWDDTSVQEAGNVIFQTSCAFCHVATETGPALGGDFRGADFPQSLEERPDFYFWTLSEGRLDKGMIAFVSSLSEEERWQVLTYTWSLGGEVPPTTTPPPDREEGTLLLTLPDQAQSGQPLTMTATLLHEDGEPVPYATVKFFIQVDFFVSGLMEIGEAVTNGEGAAVFEYIPRQTSRQTGEITNLPLLSQMQVTARYEGDGLSPVETTAMLTLVEAEEPFYQAEAGFKFPALGEEVFIGPESALEPDEAAPTSALRLPGGILSGLLIVVAAVILIWATYFRVLYQVFRIPIVSEIRDTDTRLVPLAGLVIVLLMVVMMVLLIVTGPYSHFHLLG